MAQCLFDNICTTLVEDLKQQSIPATESKHNFGLATATIQGYGEEAQ